MRVDEHGRRSERRHGDRVDGHARRGHRRGTGLEGRRQPLARIGLGAIRGHADAGFGAPGAEQRAVLVDDGRAHPRHADVDAERAGHTGSKLVRSVCVVPVSAAR